MAAPLILPAAVQSSLEAAVEALRAGGIVVIPTETLYGLTVLPKAESLTALLVAKHRPTDKGIALAVDSVAQVEMLAQLPAVARRLAARFWPGPLTLVVAPRDDQHPELPGPLLGPSGALAFRLPDHPVPRYLAAHLGPLALTSANASGGPDARTVADVVAAVGGALALVLDDGPVRGGVASTVIAVGAAGDVTVLRRGALDPEEVFATLA